MYIYIHIQRVLTETTDSSRIVRSFQHTVGCLCHLKLKLSKKTTQNRIMSSHCKCEVRARMTRGVWYKFGMRFCDSQSGRGIGFTNWLNGTDRAQFDGYYGISLSGFSPSKVVLPPLTTSPSILYPHLRSVFSWYRFLFLLHALSIVNFIYVEIVAVCTSSSSSTFRMGTLGRNHTNQYPNSVW